MMTNRILKAIMVISAFAVWMSCKHYIFVPELSDAEEKYSTIKQTGDTLHIPLYIHVDETKLSLPPTYIYPSIQYRVIIDDEEYSDEYISTDRISNADENHPQETCVLIVAIPSNDTHAKREITVETRNEYMGKEKKLNWGDWTIRFQGSQECIPSGQPLPYPDLSQKDIQIKSDKDSCLISGFDSWTVRELKKAIYRSESSELKLSAEYNWLDAIALYCDNELKDVPGNHTLENKESHYGELLIWGTTYKRFSISLTQESFDEKTYTRIGRITDMDFIDSIRLSEAGLITLSLVDKH